MLVVVMVNKTPMDDVQEGDLVRFVIDDGSYASGHLLAGFVYNQGTAYHFSSRYPDEVRATKINLPGEGRFVVLVPPEGSENSKPILIEPPNQIRGAVESYRVVERLGLETVSKKDPG